MSSECLKIQKVGGSGRSFLKLEGTVLIYNEKNWISESKLMIPIELIHISEHPRFYKDLLTLVVLIPILTLLIVIYLSFRKDINFNEIKEMLFPIIGVIVLLEFVMLFALVFNFLFTKKTISLELAGTDFEIEFWKKRKNAKRIDLFLEQIKQKQLQIEDHAESQPGQAFEIRDVNPIGRLIGLWILFCIPSLIFEKPILLLLSLIPIAWYFYSSLQVMRQPKEFRQALKKFRCKRWDEAIKLLLRLYEQYPNYIPAIYLLLDTYIHAERFDEALSFISEIPEDYFQDINVVYLNIWKWKRIHMRRIDSN